jgi:MYXO-CTERM domain-containing protein
MSGSAAITVKNNGTVPIALGAILTTEPIYTVDKSGSAPMIPAGGTTTFSVTYAPTTAGPSTAQVTVTLAGESKALQTVTVTGIGVIPASEGGGGGGSSPGCSVAGGASRAPWAMAWLLLLALPATLVRRRRV